MSMLLFIIYIEPLLTKIESNLVGIPTPGGRVRSRAFVDDITVFIGSQQDLNTCGEILSNFTNWSGAVVNPTKTQILGLGTGLGRIAIKDRKIRIAILFLDRDRDLRSFLKNGIVIGILHWGSQQFLRSLSFDFAPSSGCNLSSCSPSTDDFRSSQSRFFVSKTQSVFFS